MMITFLAEHWLDITTTVLGLAYILLEYRASVWMWLVGFLMQSLGIILYYQKGLYADCGMEFYYLAMTVYGWWRWIKPKANSQKPIAISLFPRRLVLPWLLLIAAIWAFIYWLLVTFTNSNVPDVVTSVLYFYKDIPFKASLYALYVVIAIAGWFKWRNIMASQRES